MDLFELHGNADATPADWLARRDAFETALSLFESARFAEACRAIYPLLPAQDGHYDVPSLTLASRALDCLKAPPEKFDPTVNLVSK